MKKRKHRIHIVAAEQCGWGYRCINHCRMLRNVKYTTHIFPLKEINTLDRSKVDFTKPFPHVYLDDVYLGGFYELVEKFPL